ncbi:MAG: 2-oxoacid:acceptor oxidoreductase subunit alpha, partial [Candidatus Cloacimonetes bacterium]|nr:2-oxoacid:acceptor oxidoreductase subunit alpha [Candidatus Cloacimonadota bacterium]
YGITSRIANKALELANNEGIKVGYLRPVVIWPFPEKRVRQLSNKIKAFVVPEINYGQIVYEVERCAGGNCNVVFVPHDSGSVHNPKDILHAIKKAIQEKRKVEKIIEY